MIVIEKCRKCGKEFARGIFPQKICDQCEMGEPIPCYCENKIRRNNESK